MDHFPQQRREATCFREARDFDLAPTRKVGIDSNLDGV